MTIYAIYDEIADLIANLDPVRVSNLRASASMQQRFELLAAKSANHSLDYREKDELDHYIVLERLVRLSKIRTMARVRK